MTVQNIYPFRPRSFSVDGYRLSYLDEGRGPVIVMLHGNPTWSFYYRNLVMLLRDRYRIIVPDHLGCGLSDKPEDYPYRLSNHIDNLEKLLDHLGLEEHSLVVHDWGGAIGMGYAGRHPERIQSLLILNTAAFRSGRIPWRIRICRTPFLGAFLVRGLNVFARGALSMAVTRGLSAQVKRGYLSPYNSWRKRVAIQAFIEDIPLECHHPSWETLLQVEGGLVSLSDKPTMILWGGRDFCFNDHFFREWQKRFPGARSIYLENAGHYILEDGAGTIEPMISGFFDEFIGGGPGENGDLNEKL